MIRYTTIAAAAVLCTTAAAQHDDKFRQLDELLPTPNAYRAASGAPGHAYWQQRVDYDIDVTLDEQQHWVTGSETIAYHNNSPDTLHYLWLQLDQNNFAPNSRRNLSQTTAWGQGDTGDQKEMTVEGLDGLIARHEFEGGHRITRVEDAAGAPLEYTINKTMMRVDLPEPLKPKGTFAFEIDWNFPVVNLDKMGARSGREYFEADGNWSYLIAQWFPRLCVYSDDKGWQNRPFISSEFALEFGDYTVDITVPDDHIVASSGELQNPEAVLTEQQRRRLAEARTADDPMFIITPEEAEANESSRPGGMKTWTYHAENVRDFAWASSRKYIWDAQGHRQDGNFTMAMSFYPEEAEPLWSQYSTHAVIQALETYGSHLFPYPYPVINSVNWSSGGMEYPMMTFNGARPEEDGTYGRYTKYGLISVVIHEVGHTWFPMVVNSDERQWTWMDEGLNTFMQFLTEQEWEEEYPSRRGFPRELVDYFLDQNKVPIMTAGDELLQVGNNAYGKPAVALNILRETVLGRELFDYALRTYAERWKFKKPRPADLFRTMEDASGTDLDWFWRGWFYTTDSVDIAIDDVTRYARDPLDPREQADLDRQEEAEEPPEITRMRNREKVKRVEKHPELLDFYNTEYDKHEVSEDELDAYETMLEDLTSREKALLDRTDRWYVVEFANKGGLVMPIILEVTYTDGSSEILRFPAQIWRYDNDAVSKRLILEKEIASLELDPYRETGDVNTENNHFPPKIETKRFEITPEDEDEKNPMQKAREREDGESAED